MNKIKLLSIKLKKIEKYFLKKKIFNNKYIKIVKKYNKLKIIINYLKELKKYKDEIKKLKKIKNAEELKIIILEEIKNNKKKIKIIKKKIYFLFKNKNKKNIFLEINTGVGGEEAALFANELLQMYVKYSEKKSWKVKIISYNISKLKGCKEAIIHIKGNNVYNLMKFESGVHRVQRFPITESKNKIHTSTCKIAILNKNKNKKNIIYDKDLKIETYKSSGAGGQHVNKTNSAIRIKHIPTGITVECQNERSQHKNKKLALKAIKLKIGLKEEEKKIINKKEKKRNLSGKGNRSEKIRTYNYPKNKLIDHRIKLNLNKLNWIMEGNLNIIIKKLIKKEKNKIIKKYIK